jgi:hypothetical protein
VRNHNLHCKFVRCIWTQSNHQGTCIALVFRMLDRHPHSDMGRGRLERRMAKKGCRRYAHSWDHMCMCLVQSNSHAHIHSSRKLEKISKNDCICVCSTYIDHNLSRYTRLRIHHRTLRPTHANTGIPRGQHNPHGRSSCIELSHSQDNINNKRKRKPFSHKGPRHWSRSHTSQLAPD